MIEVRTQVSDEQLRSEVARGAAYLDRAEPDWFLKVDPHTLEMGRGCDCVIGQLRDSYVTGIRELSPPEVWCCPDDRCNWAQAHGFYVPSIDWRNAGVELSYEVMNRRYGKLDEYWREEILARRLRRVREKAMAAKGGTES